LLLPPELVGVCREGQIAEYTVGTQSNTRGDEYIAAGGATKIGDTVPFERIMSVGFQGSKRGFIRRVFGKTLKEQLKISGAESRKHISSDGEDFLHGEKY
jgi:hypothetical protein